MIFSKLDLKPLVFTLSVITISRCNALDTGTTVSRYNAGVSNHGIGTRTLLLDRENIP